MSTTELPTEETTLDPDYDYEGSMMYVVVVVVVYSLAILGFMISIIHKTHQRRKKLLRITSSLENI